MTTVLLVAALVSLPLSALYVGVVLLVVLAEGPRRPAAVLAAALGTALVLVWFALGVRAMDVADATAGTGDVFDDVGWLVAAVLASTGALLAWRARNRVPAGTTSRR